MGSHVDQIESVRIVQLSFSPIDLNANSSYIWYNIFCRKKNFSATDQPQKSYIILETKIFYMLFVFSPMVLLCIYLRSTSVVPIIVEFLFYHNRPRMYLVASVCPSVGPTSHGLTV